MEGKYLKAELQSLGIRIEGEKGRAGGAGPAAGIVILFGNTQANVPTMSPFVLQSPYTIKKSEKGWIIRKNGEKIANATIPKKPRFYELKTKDGIPYKKIALLHGVNCLATTLIQTCIYWKTPKRCKFCGIGISLERGDTIPRKTPSQLAEVASMAKELDGIKHLTITTGTTGTKDKGIKLLKKAGEAVKERTGLPVHVQFEPPENPNYIDELYGSVDTVGIHIESFDERVLRNIAPCKADIGIKKYIESWKRAVELFGEGQVSSYLIVGIGEEEESIVEGSRFLVELGVYPFIVPLRPIPGTMLENESPPPAERMENIYEKVADILHDAGMTWRKNKAGCVKCRACSGLPEFEY
ncbi:MAG: MSMEG_0568 family radical SAM protein [Candidatus Syntropharchaeia archaeon]